jgi:hypothetical protein
MSEKTEVVTQLLPKIDNAIGVVMARLSDLTEKYAADTVDLGLTVVRLECFFIVLAGVLGTVISGILLYRSVQLLTTAYGLMVIEENKPIATRVEAPFVVRFIVGGIGTSVSCIALTVFTFSYLMNFWAWAGVYDPKLYLAHKILEKIL